jgi:SAM-dependent methyltransferase
MSATSRYIHGTAPDEQARLSRLNDILNESCLREIALAGGERVIDFGSGLGQLTRAMARVAGPRGRVVGIEFSREQIAEASRQAAEEDEEGLVEWRQGDVTDPPLGAEEWGTFDVAHTRFVLEHVRDPLAVVRQMVRAVRPGGRVVLADDDHDVLRMWPEPPGFVAVWEAYVRTYDRNGTDAFVGRRLVALLHEAGAAPVRVSQVFFGSCSGHPTFPAFIENIVRILEGAREAILETGGTSPAAFFDALVAFREWGRRPDAVIWYSMPVAEGVRPAAGRN